MDLIGPWIIQVCNRPYEFNALTVIDNVSNLVELVRIDKKTAAHVARKYAQVWLSRYPCDCAMSFWSHEKIFNIIHDAEISAHLLPQ